MWNSLAEMLEKRSLMVRSTLNKKRTQKKKNAFAVAPNATICIAKLALVENIRSESTVKRVRHLAMHV